MDSVSDFFTNPVLNSPYEYPARHWELDDKRQPTGKIRGKRRKVSFATPIPSPRNSGSTNPELPFGEIGGEIGAADDQKYEHAWIIESVRNSVDRWREIPDSAQQRVTPETARLLNHWRNHSFNRVRPFFCQVEAVETVIWLTEVAPKGGKHERSLLEHLSQVNSAANSSLSRLALKLATGAGKTAVMAMLIAWQTINALRHPNSKRFTRGFLVVTPGITIKDSLRVLWPNDPESYYKTRELVPRDMLGDLDRAKIVITNFHAFKRRETLEISKGGRALLKGHGPELRSIESEGQMLRRVMPELLGIKNIFVLNDEAHHCYRSKPEDAGGSALRGDELKEAKKHEEAARLWISGLEAAAGKMRVSRVTDLSATPFFLRGSGYAEGTLFPWTMCDFSLMDAIECGIVKLPRVPVADNVPGSDMPKLRNLWEHIGKDMPKRGRSRTSNLDSLNIPPMLQTAIEALYGHYEKTFRLWKKQGIEVPPCFILVCNNTSTSKLLYDYIAGYHRGGGVDGSTVHVPGRLKLFQNHDDHGNPFGRPRTLLIDSEQLESGLGLDDSFRKIAKNEIDRFRRDRIGRTGNIESSDKISDAELLREVMNTVGKIGQLGESVRCVVSVSMLTEGWDANTVTHVLGVRAFGTQLLCEQAVGRALRRQSYELNDEGRFPVEYADVLGIPFDFTAQPVVAAPLPPRKTVQVKAIIPERNPSEICFPRIVGYRVQLPEDRLEANFNPDSTMELTPELVGPSVTRNEGIIGEGVDLDLVHTCRLRRQTLLYHLTKRLLETKWRDNDGNPKLHLFGQLKRITRLWLDDHLNCKGGTCPPQLMNLTLADEACERITQGIVMGTGAGNTVTGILDPYTPRGSTRLVDFKTSKTNLWATALNKCHVNYAVCDSNWESEFCRVAEAHPKICAYIKNQGLGLEVPYRLLGESRIYIPDFIVRVDDGRGEHDLLSLIVEIKGVRREDAKVKQSTMNAYWVPAANALKEFGRWAFAEFTDAYGIEDRFDKIIDNLLSKDSPK